MRKLFLLISGIIIGIFLFSSGAFAQESSGGYCGDGTCESTENISGSYCPADCCGDGTCSIYEASAGICPVDCCGDGRVTGGENCGNCPEDAGECPYCGDDTCSPDAGETCNNCSNDCGECLVCGDDICSAEIGEDCDICAIDCGACPIDDDDDDDDTNPFGDDDDDDDDDTIATGVIPEVENPDEYDSDLLRRINNKFGIKGRDPTLDGVIFCDPSNC